MFVKSLTLPQKIGLAAIILFITSLFLPAFVAIGENSGWMCFKFCYLMFVAPFLQGDMGKNDWLEWSYYSGFALANTGFIILTVGLFTSKKKKRQFLRKVIALTILVQVLSWLVCPLTRDHSISDIGVGYYVWLAAYVLLMAAHLIKVPKLLETTDGLSVG